MLNLYVYSLELHVFSLELHVFSLELHEYKNLTTPWLAVAFQVLHSAVTGHSSSSLTRVSKSLSDFLLDTDFTNIWETQAGFVGAASLPSSFQRPFSADSTLSEPISDPGRMSSPHQHDQGRKSETDIVKLAARAVTVFSLFYHILYLRLSHFSMQPFQYDVSWDKIRWRGREISTSLYIIF